MNLRLINNIFRHSLVAIGFCVLSLSVFGGISLAGPPGIRITEPQDGLTVTPGQEITVTVEAVEGFEIKWIRVGVARFLKEEKITSLPATVTVTIPLEAAGKISILAFGVGVSDPYISDKITLNVQQTATLQSLKVNKKKWNFKLDWNGNIEGYYPYMGTVYGIYSDGIERDITKNAGTTYVSSDPSVVSLDIDDKGRVKVQAHKAGEASITVSNSGVNVVIPVVFEQPTGIRPSETISPTIQINIQPPANVAGWHNQDIIITLTATDNEGGSGVKEIEYLLAPMSPGNSSKHETVTSNITEIPISNDGLFRLVYFALDNENNKEGGHIVDLKLDKTPPQLTLQLKPVSLSENHREDEDKKKKEDKENEEEGSWYELIYSATDTLSGLKTIKAGLMIIPLNSYQIELEKGEKLEIRIGEMKKTLKIEAPDPQEILNQLQNGLLNLNNNQILQLKLKQGEPEWKIEQKEKGLEIQAPSIIFKAEAADLANNQAAKELEFEKK